jgi:hypothetical protein
MIYNGKRIKAVKKGAYFPEGKKMIVWDSPKIGPLVRTVYYILAAPINVEYPVYCINEDGTTNCYKFCAELPKEADE